MQTPVSPEPDQFFHVRIVLSEYPLRIVIGVGLCGAAAVVANVRFQQAFAVLALLYEIAWIWRFYGVLA